MELILSMITLTLLVMMIAVTLSCFNDLNEEIRTLRRLNEILKAEIKNIDIENHENVKRTKKEIELIHDYLSVRKEITKEVATSNLTGDYIRCTAKLIKNKKA